MISRFTFRRDDIHLPDSRVLKLRRCVHGAECIGHGWVGADKMTLQVTTDSVGPGVNFLHFSLSYAKMRAPSAAEVRMVRQRLRELGAGKLVVEPLVYVRNHVVQCLEILPATAAYYRCDLPLGARLFDLDGDSVLPHTVSA